MKQTISTSFLEIVWENPPRQSTIAKGCELYKAKHVSQVKEVRESGKLIEINGRCIRQTNISDSPWFVNITLNSERKVVGFHCNCPAGASGCKHIAALFQYVNNERDESSTDEKCKFKAPSSLGKRLYPKGQEMESIFHVNVKTPAHDFKDISIEAKRKLLEFMVAAGNTSCPLFNVCSIEASAPKEAQPQEAINSPKAPVFPDWVKENVFVEDSAALVAPPKLSEDELAFFTKHVVVTKDKAFEICLSSAGQSTSKVWQEERRKRITASRAHQIWRARSDSTRIGYFQCLKSIEGLPALKYGLDQEENARLKYNEVTGNQVAQVGLVIKTELPWLAASPDGLFISKDKKLVLLEIKCPYSNKGSKIDVPYIKKGELDKKHCYYTQLQLSMMVTNAKAADFFVFSSEDFQLINVPFDEDFV